MTCKTMMGATYMTHGNEAGKQYKSEVMADIHAAAQDLRDLNLISKETMAEFDKNCLTPIEPMAPEEIRALRDREAASQMPSLRSI